MRGGKRKGAGRKAGSKAKRHRKQDTMTLFSEDWKQLDKIGPSRGKAVEKMLEYYMRDRSLITIPDDELEDTHNEIVDELVQRGLLVT